MRPLTKRQSEILALADGTRTLTEVARAIGVSGPGAVAGSLSLIKRKGYEPKFRLDMRPRSSREELREQMLALCDGTRTRDEVARALGYASWNGASNSVRRLGIDAHFKPALPAGRTSGELLIEKLQLPTEARAWLLKSVPNGATVHELVRSIIIDAYQDEVGA